MEIGSVVLQIIDTFSSFVDFFFRPIDNSIITNLFGDVSLFAIIFGVGLTAYIVYQLVIWALNIIT